MGGEKDCLCYECVMENICVARDDCNEFETARFLLI